MGHCLPRLLDRRSKSLLATQQGWSPQSIWQCSATRETTLGTTFVRTASRTLAGRERLSSGYIEHLRSGGVDHGCPGRCLRSVAGPCLQSLAQGVWHLRLAGLVVSDIAVTRWGRFPPMHRPIIFGPERGQRTVSLKGATRRGDVYDTSLGVSPLRRAMSLLHRRSFQQVSRLLVNALSLIGRGLKSHSHDHGS